MGSTKGTLGGKKGGWDKGTKEGGYFYVFSDAESEQHGKPLWPWLSCLLLASEEAWHRCEQSGRI